MHASSLISFALHACSIDFSSDPAAGDELMGIRWICMCGVEQQVSMAYLYVLVK
jgi:hypothetical protein